MSTLTLMDNYDTGRQTKRTNMPPLTFTWPLIIALSACGGGGGSGSKPTVFIRADIKEEVVDTVNDVHDGKVRIGGKVIKKPVGGDDQGKDEAPPNFAPKHTFDNPNFQNGDSDEEHNALIVGQEFSYTIPPNTFSDPEGDSITYSIDQRSLPPGLTFDPSTRTISGRLEDFRSTNPDGIAYKITIIGTDPQGRVVKDGMIMAVVMPNDGPQRTDATLSNINKTVDDNIRINFKKYFSDPEGDPLRFTLDKLPPGMVMQTNGPWFYGRPTEAFDKVITVTATDTVSGKTETMQFRFTATTPNAAPVTGSSNTLQDQATGESVDYLIPANDLDVTVHDQCKLRWP